MSNKTEIRCFKRWIILQNAPKASRNLPEPKVTAAHKVKISDAELGNQVSLGSQWTVKEDKLLVEKVTEYGT